MEPINVFDYETMAKASMDTAAWNDYSSGGYDEVALCAKWRK
ncbi:MAG TPA: hypothetical protein VFZ02_14105 [Ktedonobacteraceae bacterium]